MDPRARRFLRRSFIAAFFLVAPAVILSTSGYRFNPASRRFERTGVMIVESRPEGAAIFVDGRDMGRETPARLQKLSPGSYGVRVEKAGYRSWEKSVTVGSRQTTFLNEVALFRSGTPSLLAESGTTSREAFSHDGRWAAAVTETRSGSELAVFDLRDGSETRPYRTSAAADALTLSWSRDGRRLLVRQDGPEPAHLLWEASAPGRMRDVSEAAGGLALDAAFWAQDADRLYAEADGILYDLDAGLGIAVPAGPAPAAPVVADGAVYGILDGAPATLVRHRLREPSYETVAVLPSSAFVPLPGRDGKIAYVSAADERLFVIDPASERAGAFEGRGRGGAWSSDGQRLLYWNDLEVRIYDARTGEDALITRLSGPIRQAAWHRPEWNAIYASGQDLYAVETSDRFGRLTVPLGRFDELRSFAVSRDGADLHAFGTFGGQRGLWKLNLR